MIADNITYSELTWSALTTDSQLGYPTCLKHIKWDMMRRSNRSGLSGVREGQHNTGDYYSILDMHSVKTVLLEKFLIKRITHRIVPVHR